MSDVGGPAADLIVRWLIRRAQRTPPIHDPLTDAQIARYTGAARVFAWVLFGSCAAFGGLLTCKVPVAGRFTCGTISLIFTAAMAAAVLDFSRVSLRWNEHRVVFNSPWRGERALCWVDFNSVKFSPVLGWFVLRSRDGVVIRPPMMCGGLNEFFAALKAHGSPSLQTEIERALAQWRERAR